MLLALESDLKLVVEDDATDEKTIRKEFGAYIVD